MTDQLPVEVNEDGLHTLSVPASFAAEGAFEVVLRNHGEAAHVHLNLDTDLSAVASLAGTNHYVEGDSVQAVRVDVPPGAGGGGTLTVATGYGGTSRDVRVDGDAADSASVEVGESLADPPRRDRSDPALPAVAPVVGLVALAAVLGLVATVTQGATVVVLAALAVLAAGLAAAYAAYVYVR